MRVDCWLWFPQARIANQDDWLVAFDVGPASQLQDTRLGNGRDATPVKLGQLLEDGEVGFPDRSVDPLSFAVGYCFLHQSQHITFVGKIGPRRFMSQRLV